MKITAIIVTYSDRFHLLKQVLDSCFEEGVSNIIIIDNNSHKNSKIQLEKYSKTHKNKTFVIWNSSNLGSAKGYKQGLKEVKIRNLGDYIWLLDDDNKPRKKSLEKLKEYWNKKSNDVKALLSYRPDRLQYRQAIIENNPNLVLGLNNSFSGFHLKLKAENFFSKKKYISNLNQVGEIAYAPYGGMFFHKSIFDEIGYPNEDYFLYSDDHDWSYRITKSNKKIYLVLNSVIDDIDSSWNLINKTNNTFIKIKKAPSLRVYYSVRNRMMFEKNNLIDNKLIYNLNKLAFTCLLFCFCFGNKNFKVFKKAVRHANTNNFMRF